MARPSHFYSCDLAESHRELQLNIDSAGRLWQADSAVSLRFRPLASGGGVRSDKRRTDRDADDTLPEYRKRDHHQVMCTPGPSSGDARISVGSPVVHCLRNNDGLVCTEMIGAIC